MATATKDTEDVLGPAPEFRSTETFLTQRADVEYRYQEAAHPAGTLRSDLGLPDVGAEIGLDTYDAPSLQASVLLRKTKEMNEVQRELQRKREDFMERMRRCQSKEEELLKKQQAIKEQVIKFEKFLRENDAKRKRANQKISEEAHLRENKERELEMTQVKLENISDQKNELKRQRDVMLLYEQYLEAVTQENSDLPDIPSVLNRYRTLRTANVFLSQRQQDDYHASEKVRTALSALIKENQNEILVGSSEMALLQQRLEALRLENAQTEATLNEMETVWKKQWREYGETKMAVHNLYQRAVSKPQPDVRTPLDKLTALLLRIQDLTVIVNEYEPHIHGRKQPVETAPLPPATSQGPRQGAIRIVRVPTKETESVNPGGSGYGNNHSQARMNVSRYSAGSMASVSRGYQG
eukprot:GCRY01004681.1.p1 GENE.GCRY01004681.1~~GCRY01004681.1.p1  ORF type:complete len:410 (+),score=99.74 GCRY01004681.1:301-1530(+)